MKKHRFELFERVALGRDFVEKSLYSGDLATIVDCHPAINENGEPGYSLEVFNAIGETIAVIVVAESDIRALRADEVLHARSMENAIAA